MILSDLSDMEWDMGELNDIGWHEYAFWHRNRAKNHLGIKLNV